MHVWVYGSIDVYCCCYRPCARPPPKTPPRFLGLPSFPWSPLVSPRLPLRRLRVDGRMDPWMDQSMDQWIEWIEWIEWMDGMECVAHRLITRSGCSSSATCPTPDRDAALHRRPWARHRAYLHTSLTWGSRQQEQEGARRLTSPQGPQHPHL